MSQHEQSEAVSAPGVDASALQGLRNWNIGLSLLHLAQVVAVLVLASSFAISVTSSFPTGPPGSKPPAPEALFDVRIGVAIAIFLGLAALDHLLTGTVLRGRYERDLRAGINRFRWVEYSFSASLMLVLIAFYTGITDIAALIAIMTGLPAGEVTGRGTGIDDPTLAHKIAVVQQAIEVNHAEASEPMAALAAVGGFEHAALVGYLLGAAARHTPVVLDGVISCAAALVAQAIAPAAVGYWIAGHRSAEPGASAALAALGLTPLVDLGLRLGEGSGAALAVPLVQAAARVLREVATFDAAGVTDTHQPH